MPRVSLTYQCGNPQGLLIRPQTRLWVPEFHDTIGSLFKHQKCKAQCYNFRCNFSFFLTQGEVKSLVSRNKFPDLFTLSSFDHLNTNTTHTIAHPRKFQHAGALPRSFPADVISQGAPRRSCKAHLQGCRGRSPNLEPNDTVIGLMTKVSDTHSLCARWEVA
jgi:hypothetical protein